VLFDLARDLNKAKTHEPEKVAGLAANLKQLASLLGLLQDAPDAFLKGDADDDIEQQIQARIDAKKAKDWATADKIRNDLKANGIILEDSPDGTTSWRRE
jgi:cysteinyl-tRNA synthetase